MSDGIELVCETWGGSGCPPAILLHGGGQTRHAWKRTARLLAARGFYAVTIDLRGHGDSGWSPDGDYSIDRFAEDVRTVASAIPRRPILIGASLGGIAGLIAEGESQGSIASALVLVDITPRVEAAGVMRIWGFMASHIDAGFGSLDEAADVVAAYLPNRRRPRTTEGLRKNLRLGKDGRYRWHYDPAFVRNISMRDGEHARHRLSGAASRLPIPVLLVRGGSSELVSEAAAREFVTLVPQATYVDVQGAGHMVAGDLNDAFTQEVIYFLDGLRSSSSSGP